MSTLDKLIETHPLPTWRRAAWLVALIVATAAVWANFARLDEVAMAPGEVVPQGQVKVVQHLEGGIIKTIDVTEGDRVAAGDPLVQLELGALGMNESELRVQIGALELKRARLAAEASGEPLAFPEDIARRLPDLVRNERDAFESRRRRLEGMLSMLKEQTSQRTHEITEVETRRAGLEANLEIGEERLRMTRSLLKDDLVPRLEFLELESEVGTQRSQLAELKSALPKLKAALAEAKERETVERLEFRRAVLEELAGVELALARNAELLSVAADQTRRTTITSPIAGVVKNLRATTIGGVVRPGEPIMEIVPTQENLVIEANLDPVDVGYVRVGQPAVVKLLTYDFIRYGGLDGEVVGVAPDSSVDRNGNPFFRVVVKTAHAYIGETPGAFPITPGMQATVDIHTGEKSVLQYLITPVLKLRHEAFRER